MFYGIAGLSVDIFDNTRLHSVFGREEDGIKNNWVYS